MYLYFTFLLCVVIRSELCCVRDRFNIRSPVIMYASKRCLVLACLLSGIAVADDDFVVVVVVVVVVAVCAEDAVEVENVVPFAVGIFDSFGILWPCGDCGPFFDVVCTGLLIIVGMRDFRHDKSRAAAAADRCCCN